MILKGRVSRFAATSPVESLATQRLIRELSALPFACRLGASERAHAQSLSTCIAAGASHPSMLASLGWCARIAALERVLTAKETERSTPRPVSQTNDA